MGNERQRKNGLYYTTSCGFGQSSWSCLAPSTASHHRIKTSKLSLAVEAQALHLRFPTAIALDGRGGQSRAPRQQPPRLLCSHSVQGPPPPSTNLVRLDPGEDCLVKQGPGSAKGACEEDAADRVPGVEKVPDTVVPRGERIGQQPSRREATLQFGLIAQSCSMLEVPTTAFWSLWESCEVPPLSTPSALGELEAAFGSSSTTRQLHMVPAGFHARPGRSG